MKFKVLQIYSRNSCFCTRSKNTAKASLAKATGRWKPSGQFLEMSWLGAFAYTEIGVKN
jgi:hypothetical protein